MISDKPVPYLPFREWERLINAATSARNRAVIGLLLYCGLRESELRRLDLIDLDVNRQCLWVARAYTGAPDCLDIPTTAMGLLGDYLAERPEVRGHRGEPLFVSRQHTRLSKRQVRNIVTATAWPLYGDWVTPETLRESCGVVLTQRSGERKVVAGLLGMRERERVRRWEASLRHGMGYTGGGGLGLPPV